mmetsp:Transcript_37768/g.61203  ORF Transcript_37768/g.61203 Transcript_37768/m.61203 type:complete len:933 (-) Transcript_37768:1406-4204(-)|eukprot:CAMPEP_0184370190 /NCGR_PEP_ID=MMETSP1089-20130417/162672_1 /TAXON_ID=38269 ORGANISM="Gloeochaete wittrockiana, Strain SAG46.84" /NCGR_SAMPLE_ID=MMETSP1089 /ASSEMBLY_ACC=CAM_ASM_000445 /LENGTH=932 /DNA_ID=CAMNT_0026712759 /DNA_START=75 /DNA_END=2873 /DNA_ORIENTATION=-
MDSGDAINLTTLMELKAVFEHADVDGGGSLSLDEFVEAFGGILGKNMTSEQLTHLFMKIDANSDGNVDWDEFSTFMLLESQGTAVLREGIVNEYHPMEAEADPNEKYDQKVYHSDMIDRILLLDRSEKYITTSRDGTLRVWNAKNLQWMRTVVNGKAWITDVVHMRECNKLAVSSIDRSISFYDSASIDCVGRIRDLDNAPMCLGYWPVKDRDMLAFGDDAGFLHVYHMYDGVLEGTKVFKQKTHKDWVTKVRYIPEMASVVSSSMDNTIKVGDVEKKILKITLEGHVKGVYSFDWCRAYKFFASCGLERHIILWNPYTSKPMATLPGHNASVREVIINDRFNQLISLSVDKVIKVWDVRNHRCLQTVVDKERYRPENRISGLLYDPFHKCIVTGTTKLRLLPMQRREEGESGRKSHEFGVGGALYNHTFHQVVSGDDGGVVCVWDVDTGDIVFRFTTGAGEETGKRITALTFDAAGRRLITGTHDGTVQMWNFSNGACLKELRHSGHGEISAVKYIDGGVNKYIVAVGWDRKVIVWLDGNTYVLNSTRELPEEATDGPGNGKGRQSRREIGHKDDILDLDFCPPNILATCSYDGDILIWNLDSGYCKCILRAPEDDLGPDPAIQQVVFLAKRGNTLLSCGADGKMRIWNVRDARHVHSFHAGHAQGEPIISMSTDQSDSYIFTADAAGYVKVWDVSHICERIAASDSPLLVELSHWRAHMAAIVSVDYIDRSKMVLTASTDGTISMWTLQGAHVGVFRPGSNWNLVDPSTFMNSNPVPVEIVVAAKKKPNEVKKPNNNNNEGESSSSGEVASSSSHHDEGDEAEEPSDTEEGSYTRFTGQNGAFLTSLPGSPKSIASKFLTKPATYDPTAHTRSLGFERLPLQKMENIQPLVKGKGHGQTAGQHTQGGSSGEKDTWGGTDRTDKRNRTRMA